jgi:cellulose synthase operon protein C
VRKTIVDVCQRLQQSGQDVTKWAAAARRSIDRLALVAAADASIVIDDIVGAPDTPARRTMKTNERAKCLLAFALSPGFLAIRRKFGMGIA